MSASCVITFRVYIPKRNYRSVECVQREDALRSPPRRAEARSAARLRGRILVEGTCESLGPKIGAFIAIRGSPRFTQLVHRS